MILTNRTINSIVKFATSYHDRCEDELRSAETISALDEESIQIHVDNVKSLLDNILSRMQVAKARIDASSGDEAAYEEVQLNEGKKFVQWLSEYASLTKFLMSEASDEMELSKALLDVGIDFAASTEHNRRLLSEENDPDNPLPLTDRTSASVLSKCLASSEVLFLQSLQINSIGNLIVNQEK